MNDAYVKVFTEERELTVMLLVDVSASQTFGSTARSKAEMAAEVAAQIAFSAIANNDRVGLVLFSDQIERIVPPKKGKKHVLRVITEILTFTPRGTRTDISAALSYLQRVAKRRAVTFLISDFLASGYEPALRIAGRKHDLVPVAVADPFEGAFPNVGLVELEDPETGATFVVDSAQPRIRGAFAKEMKRRAQERDKLFKKLQLDYVELKSHEEYGAALQRFFRLRARRLAG